MAKPATTRIEISPKTLITVIAILLGAWFLYAIRSVLVVVFISFILTSTMLIPIEQLIKRKVPKGLAIFVVYAAIIAFFIAFISVIAAPIAQETMRFINNLPDLLQKILGVFDSVGEKLGLMNDSTTVTMFEKNLDTWVDTVSNNLGDIVKTGAEGASGVYKFISNFFGGIVTISLVFVMSIYMSYDHDNALDALFRQIRDKPLRAKVRKLADDIERNLGRWLTGQTISAMILGTLTWAILTVLGVQYALPLGMLTGLLNPIPFVGATISAIPGILIALSSGSLLQIIGVPITYIVVQQLESQLITPRVMLNAIGLPPIITILAVLIGGEIGGISGVILAVPIAGVIHIGLQFWEDARDDDEENLKK